MNNMSDTVALKIRSKNVKYYANSALGVCVMLFFGYLPTFSTVTPIGMTILGVYIGLLWLWSTVDLIWPSLLAIIIVGFSGYNTVGGLLAAGWGDGTNIYIWLICLFAYMVTKSGVSDKLVQSILSIKFAKGRPWIVSLLFLTSAYTVGALVSMTPACLIVWAFFQKFAQEMGYKKGDKYTSFMIVGIALAGLMGFSLFNFRVPGSIMIGYIAAAGGSVNFVGYSITAFLVGYGSLITYILIGKFFVRPDVERIKTGCNFVQCEKMTPYQKQILWLTILLVAAFICQSMLGSTLLGQFLTKLGSSGIVVVFLIGMGFVRRKDGGFFADLLDGTKNGVPWPVFYLLTIGMPLAFAMADEKLGIQTMLSGVFNNVLGGGGAGFLVFILVVTFAAAASTQFLLNHISCMIIFPIASAYCSTLNIDPGLLACMIAVCSNASIIFPSANPIAGVMHGMSDWISSKDIYKYAFPLVASVWLLAVVVWVLFRNTFFI
jgi:sodium-dependent dicarboxylate transporter 2/3/5